MIEVCESRAKKLATQQRAPLPAAVATVEALQKPIIASDPLRAPVTNNLNASTIAADLRSSIHADLKASTEELPQATPTTVAENRPGTSATPTIVVAPVAARTADGMHPASPRLPSAGTEEKVAAEAINFNEPFKQTCAQVDTIIAQTEKITAQKEVTQADLNKAIDQLGTMREEICSFPTENEDLKAKYEANFRPTPAIKTNEAYQALARLKVLEENEKCDALVIYSRLNTTENVLKTFPGNAVTLKEIRQLGYIFRNQYNQSSVRCIYS